MSETFTPERNLVVLIGIIRLEIVVIEPDSLGLICCVELLSFFERKVIEVRDDTHHSVAEFFRDPMVDDLEESMFFTSLG